MEDKNRVNIINFSRQVKSGRYRILKSEKWVDNPSMGNYISADFLACMGRPGR